MEGIVNNIPEFDVVQLRNLVTYQKGQEVSNTILNHSTMKIMLFAVDQDQKLNFTATKEAHLITVLDGILRLEYEGKEQLVTNGETIFLPAGIQYNIYAFECFKMMLYKIAE